jgi:hypothetical protein
METNKINMFLSDIHTEINNLNCKIRDSKEDDKQNKLNIKKLSQLNSLSNNLIKYKNLLQIKIDTD